MVNQLIPEEVVQEVLLRADIVDVIGDYVQLKRSGANAKGLCPFHQEKTPSFTVSPAKGLFYCFGCHASGNVVRFLMQHEHLSFPEAVRFLAARYGIRVPEASARQHQQDAVSPLYALHQAAAAFFHDSFLHDPAAQAARALCRQRQITQEVAIRFGLGYAPASWDALYQALRKQGFSHELLVQSGLAVVRESQRGAYDRFRHRLMFPIHDRLGRPIAFGGRLLADGEAVHAPKYLNSPETPIFHKSRVLYGLSLAKAALRQRGQALIVEGYTDVIACHRHGITHAVGTLGTALTEQHVRLLKGLVKEVVLVFDGDAAGGAATERSLGLFLDAGLRVRVATLPEGEDPDSFLRRHPGEEFLRYVDEAVTFVDYLLARAARFTDLRQPAGQADCVDRLLPLLRQVENPVERWGYTMRVAEKLGIPPGILQQRLAPRQTQTGAALYRPSLRTSTPPPRPLAPDYALLRLLCHNLHWFHQVQQQIVPEDFEDADLRAIYAVVARFASAERATAFPAMLEAVTSPQQLQLLHRMALEEASASSPAEFAAAVRDCLYKIHQRQHKAQLRHIQEQLRKSSGVADEEQRLLQEYSRLRKTQRTAPS